MDTVQSVDEPRAWIGCLGCYNDGRLNGAWLDYEAASDLTESGYTNGSGECVKCGAEEFVCMDTEGIPGFIANRDMSVVEFLQACETMQTVSSELTESEEEAFYVMLDNEHESVLNDADYLLERFRDCYRGYYDSHRDFAEELYHETENMGAMPSVLRDCIDWDRVWSSYLRFDFWEESGHYFYNS